MLFTRGRSGTKDRTCRPLRFRTRFCILIILVLALAAPVSAARHAINPGDSIQAAINAAGSGDILILNPGVYNQHDMFITKDITIRANASAGGSAANTIIDAQNAGRIFSFTGYYSLAIDNLTLQNGQVTGFGGAIMALAGGRNTITITSSAFTNCTASNAGGAISANGDNSSIMTITASTFTNCSAVNSHGGAIHASQGLLTVTASTFSSCSAGLHGGAIYAPDESTITSVTITNCSAHGSGGAIFSYTGNTAITSSDISNCSAGGGGGAIDFSGNITITSSAIANCSATYGGAIYSWGPGTVTITSTTVINCSAGAGGGAIHGGTKDITITSSTFSNCSAGDDGGAINLFSSTVTVTSTTFSNCTSAQSGGAIYNLQYSTFTISSSTFTNCSAGDDGGAIDSSYGTLMVTSSTFLDCSAADHGGAFNNYRSAITLHFSRMYRDTTGTVIWNDGGSVDAENTWWGTNAEPSGFVNGTADYTPWLVLGIVADPRTITPARTASVRTNLTFNSEGSDTSGGSIFVPANITNTFAVTAGSGSVSPSSDGTTNGIAGTTFTPAGAGTNAVSATVDDQTVFIPIPVALPVISAPPTGPTYNPGDTGTSDDSPPAIILPMTISINIGGNSAAGKATVTGTILSDLIVTGTVQYDPGSNQTAPPGIVYQYINLVPARFSAITRTVINFTVPQSWLDKTPVAPGSIVLYRQTANGWEALPTTLLYTKDGMVYFSAQSTGFSLFAIAGTPAAMTPLPTKPVTAAISSPVQEQVPVKTGPTKVPVTTQTSAPPAPSTPPSAPSPVMDIILVIASIGVLGAGGFLARRRLIRRQNPALFHNE